MWRSGFLQSSLLILTASVATAGAAAGVYSRAVAGREAQPAPLQAAAPVVKPPAVTDQRRQFASRQDEPALRDDAKPAAAADEETRGILEKKQRNYTIRLTRDGLIPGRLNVVDPVSGDVRPAMNMSIVILQHGDVIATAKPGVGGIFQIGGVKPGQYALVGAGEDGYVAYGLRVVAFDEPAGPAPAPAVRAARLIRPSGAAVAATPVSQVVEELLDIDSLIVPIRDVGAILQIVKAYVPASLTGANHGRVPEIARPGEIIDEPVPDMDGVPSDVIKKHLIEIRPDGSLVGRMRHIDPESGKPIRIRKLNVFLVKDNAIVAQAPVNESGLFTFKAVAPGTYSFAAAGIDGFAAFSVQAVQSNGVVNNPNRDWIIPVGFAPQPELFWLDGILIDPSNVEQAINYLNSLQNNNVASGGNFGNFAGNGGGGGSGAAGSGGGFAGLAAALAAAGAAVAATQNNGDTIISTSVTPVP